MSRELYVASRLPASVPLSERKFHILADAETGAALCGWCPSDGWFARFSAATLSMIVCAACRQVFAPTAVVSGHQEGWGGGLRHLHWITDTGALCSPKVPIRALVEDGAEGGYVDDYACKRCKRKLAQRSPAAAEGAR